MSNEKLAREWAKIIRDAVDQDPTKFNEKARAAAAYILDNVPEPTMADVEWDAEKHYMAGATSEIDGSERVMIAPEDGLIVNAKPGGDRVSLMSPGALTPNGKRYRLVEDTAPTHPEHLVDADDFEQAPEGTIVASDGYLSTPLVKRYGKWCRDRIEFTAEDLDAVAEQLRVLRWGWGE